MLFRAAGSENPGELNVRVNFGRAPQDLTEEERHLLEDDVFDIITSVQLAFLDRPINAETIHAARSAIGNALLEKYGDYYPRVVILPPH